MNGDVRIGDWLVQPRLARASKEGRTVHLRAKVSDLLVFLAQHPGEVISKEVLLDRVWGTEHISESALTSVVTELRQTLDDDAARPWLLQTIPKQGYRLIAPVEWTSEAPEFVSKAPRSAGLPNARIALIAGGATAALLLTGWGVSYRAERSHSHVVARAVLDVSPAKALWAQRPRAFLLGRPTRNTISISPDGRTVVFSGVSEDDRPQLYVRRLDEFTARPIRGTDRANSPVFSGDGRWIAYWVGEGIEAEPLPPKGDLLKVPLDGGPPVRLTSIGRPFGLSWMPDGSIVVGNFEGGLLKVRPGDYSAVAITTLREGERSHRLPHVLPGGRAVLYTVLGDVTRWDDAFIAVEDLATGERRKVVEGADGRYVQPGYIAFVQLGRMIVAPFDPERLRLTGDPIAAELDVMQAVAAGNEFADSGAAQLAFSENGIMAYVPGGIAPESPSTPGWVDRDGKFEAIGAPSKTYGHARLSHDGRYAAFSELGRRHVVWIYDLHRRSLVGLGIPGTGAPIWSPQSGRLVVASTVDRPAALFWAAPHLSSEIRPLVTTAVNWRLLPGAWTPDERTLIAVRSGDLLALSVQDARPTSERPLIATPAEESFPHLSPDGRWLAYASAAGGSGLQIVVQSFPDLTGRWQVSTAGGVAPCWSPDGTELFYLQSTPDGEDVREVIMMKVQFSPGSSGNHPTFGQPVRVFDFGPYETTNPTRSFDVSPDGKRFLVHRSDYPRDALPPSRINFVMNWDEEMKRRLAR